MPRVDTLNLPDLSGTDVTWSLSVIDLTDGRLLISRQPDAVLKTASVPKLLLLSAVSDLVGAGALSLDQPLDRRTTVPVGDSGIWQHLLSDVLPLGDVASFVGAYSDNLATNALLDVVGLTGVDSAAERLGCSHTRLNDYVRAERVPGVHPPTVSQGTAEELAGVCTAVEKGARSGDPAAARLISWLRRSVDHSMVLSGLGLDPLSHGMQEGGLRVWNKTGTDTGVRCDTGVISGPRAAFAYAVTANWTGAVEIRDVLDGMKSVGEIILAHCRD